ncbi:MAG: hypothetical protein HYV95_01515 [Opitutae bacterium]|nr:hypothetical protein [Opitutae bacterium]
MGIVILPTVVVMITLLIVGIVQWKRALKFPVSKIRQQAILGITLTHTLLALLIPYALHTHSKIWFLGAFLMTVKWSLVCSVFAGVSWLLQRQNNSPIGMLVRGSLCTTAGAAPLLVLFANDWLAVLFSVEFLH